MSNRSVAVLAGAAVATGILGDALLRSDPWGVGFFLWVAVLVGVTAVVLESRQEASPLELALLFVAPVFFAFGLAWRDAEVLVVWNVFAVVLALSVPITRSIAPDLSVGRVADYVAGLAAAGFSAAFGPIMLLAQDVDWEALGGRTRLRIAGGIVVGVLLAIPVALVFGGLLTSADPGFERLIRTIFDWNFQTIASHLALAAFITWITAGYLHSVAHGASRSPIPREPLGRPSLGLLEVGIPLGTLIALFVLFLVIQAEYLFGGEDLIRRTAGLTFAEHARSGFFELVAASALVLPLLLAADWVIDKNRATTVTRFRILAGVLVALVGLIMLSALHRMRLYLGAYGLSQDRVYATAVLLWVAFAIGWFAATVLRGRGKRFAFGAMVSGFSVLAVLNVINPDALVVRTNVERARDGRELDVEYLSQLSADAVPSLLAALPDLPADVRCIVAADVAREWGGEHDGDWRSWNVSRSRARSGASEVDPTADPGCAHPPE
jgi:hypothetical protein